MFIVCEPIHLGMEHVPFNAGFLKSICLAFPDEKVYFYAERSHSEFVKDHIGEEFNTSIAWREVTLPKRHANFFFRLLSDFKTVNYLLKKLNNLSNKDVLVIVGNASILWALKYYTGKEHKHKRVQVVIHGDFSTLRRTPRREILNPFYYIGCLKTALRLPGYGRLQHIVLEESVRDSILKCMPFMQNSVFVFDHPIPVDDFEGEINRPYPSLTTPIQFGFLGRATDKKGFSMYLDVASEITMQFPGKANFHFIGRISEKYRQKNMNKMASLSEIPGKERLSRSEYTNRLKKLHFVCLFYSNYYESCASGALLDCIASEKPIVANQLSLFRTIQLQYGDIGHLCNSDDFLETIRSIIQANDILRYQRQIKNMGHVKTSRTSENLAMKYTKLVKFLEKDDFSRCNSLI